MTDLSDTKPRRASYRAHDAEELQGQAPPDACTPRIACENADRAVHQVLLDQKREEKRKTLPPIAPPATHRQHNMAQGGLGCSTWGARNMQEGIFAPNLAKGAGAGRRGWFNLSWLTRRRMILLALVGFVIWWPVLVLSVLVSAVVVLAIIYVTLGHDRFVEVAQKRWKRFAQRRPERAARLRQKADALALHWDKVLDRLPEHWANRLALPDFANTVDAQINLDEAPDPFERLAARFDQG